MPDTLSAVEYTPELADLVGGFDCGTEPYQRELAEWIVRDAAEAIRRGTKVWLYVNAANDIVGYGSLGTSNWRYPDSAAKRVAVAVIPAVALDRRFWGKPDGAEPGDRYSSQILRHLLLEATGWPGQPPAVGLYVHPDNAAAIKLYTRLRFAPFHHTYTDLDTKVTYHGYVRPLARG